MMGLSQPARAISCILMAVGLLAAHQAGAVTLASRTNYATGVAPIDVAVADFNSDGDLDVACTNSNAVFGNTVSVRLGDGSGGLGARVNYSAGNIPKGIAAADLDEDGELDLVVANGILNSVSAISVLLGNGDGTFGSPTGYSVGHNPGNIALGDFDADGNIDVAATGDSTTVSVLLGNGDGSLSTAVQWGAGASPEDIATADLNDDGDVDIITSNFGTTLSLFFSVTATAHSLRPAPLQGVGTPIRAFR